MKNFVFLKFALLAISLIWTTQIFAQTSNQTNPATSIQTPYHVYATIASTCVINVTDLSFGNLSLNEKYNTISGNLIVRCSNNLPYQISFGFGNRGDRTMIGNLTRSTLNYTICTQSGFSAGQCTNTDNTLHNVGTGQNQTLPIFGYIDTSGDYPNNDTYSDTVVATVTY